MIKTNKFLEFLLIIVLSISISSCVQNDDFTVPDGINTEENKGLEHLLTSGATEISMADLKAKYINNNNTPVLLETDIYIKGYVSSSDRAGNFFKELFLQNAPENPTSGIKIIINQVETHNQYNMGREVYIKLKGLYIGEERVGNGVITLGGTLQTNQFGTAVKRFTESQRIQHLFRSATTEELVPVQLNFSQVNGSHVGIYVEFKDVEFADNLVGKRFFDSAQDFDTLRLLQSCSGSIGYSNFVLETSSFASFKDILLPTGNGMISGIITKTFDGSALVIALNAISDINMSQARCTASTIADFHIAYKEDFESARANATLNFSGWTNFNEYGKVKWKEKNHDGNGYAEFSSFNSWDSSNIAWLISPGFDVGANSKILLNFKAAQHHVVSPNNTLEIMISTNYDGTNVLDAKWISVEAAVPSQHHPWYQFVDSGLIDLSSSTGTLHIAFKVTGSGTIDSLGGAYQIDELLILVAD